MNPQPLIIKDWTQGMADSPHVGIGLLQNVEIDTFPGAVRVGKKPVTAFNGSKSTTFTADAVSDICTPSGWSIPSSATAVVFTTTGTLPAGLSTGTIYYVYQASASTFYVATTLANANAGTHINITDAGSGVHTVSTIDPGTIKHYARDPRTGTMYAHDSNGRVWVKQSAIYQLLLNAAIDTGGSGVTNGAGNGISIFRTSDGNATYLFAFRNGVVDVINVFGTSNIETPVWSNSWKSLNSGAGSGNSHHTIVGQDNIVYFCDDRYVGSILEKPGQIFDPATSATYTFNASALTLPLGSLSYWLEQLGVNLLISVSNDSYIYPWDRSSVSYNLPIPVGDYGINKMKNIGNIVYILAGTHGNIYWTQGTYVRPLKTMPIYATYNTTTPASNPITWGGITSVLGKLIVGVGSSGSGKSGAYMISVASGVESVKVNAITVDNYPSTGQANVTAIFAQNEFYEMGYAGGADVMDTSRYNTLGAVILQSPLYRVGTKTTKAKYSQVEVQIANGVSGSIRIGYRTDLSSAFTSFTDPDTSVTTFTTDTSHTSYQADIGLIDLENVQFQVELAGNIDLMEVRFNP